MTALLVSVVVLIQAALAAPLDHGRLRPGDEVYLVWRWRDEPIPCTVAPLDRGRRGTSLVLEWPDDEGGTSWTSLDADVLVFSTRRAAARACAARLVRRAEAATRRALEILEEGEKP